MLLPSAMLKLYWLAFEDWLIEQHISLDTSSELSGSLNDIVESLNEGRPISIPSVNGHKALSDLKPLMEEFENSQVYGNPTVKL